MRIFEEMKTLGIAVLSLSKNPRTGHESVCTRLGNFTDIVDFDVTINFKTNVIARLINHLACFAQFIQGCRNE